MRLGSLCTGIGGLDLAAHAVYRCELAWYSEIEPAPAALLEQLHPGVPNLGDLTTIDWTKVEPVDVLTAGYPCQPFSTAGRRQGADDDRHLWPYIADAVRVLRPRRVVLENVAGHLSLGFGDVLGDLAEAGFDAEWCVLRASDVGAPHRRTRVFVVASDADGGGRDAQGLAGVGRPVGERRDDPRDTAAPSDTGADAPADADGGAAGRDSGTAPRTQAADARREPDLGDGSPHGDRALPADADSNNRRGRGTPGHVAADASHVGHERAGSARGRGTGPTDRRGDAPDATIAERRDTQQQGVGPTAGPAAEPRERPSETAWGRYEPAIRRWEHLLGRPAPAPTDDRGQLSTTFVEWMMGYPAGWCAGMTRTQALKALGNAVVPQQGAAAIALLEDALAREVAA